MFCVKTNKLRAVHLIGAVLEEYSRTRNKDVEAICDLSMYNYLEVISEILFILDNYCFCMKKKSDIML